MGQGPQENESAIEQAKDEQISDFIRGKYKGATGRCKNRHWGFQWERKGADMLSQVRSFL